MDGLPKDKQINEKFTSSSKAKTMSDVARTNIGH